MQINPFELTPARPLSQQSRYVEEHITIYNLDDLSEHKVVLLRLSSGQLQQHAFSYAPSESAFGYSALEEDILRFHSAFIAQWDR